MNRSIQSGGKPAKGSSGSLLGRIGFLVAVVALYLVMAVAAPHETFKALGKSWTLMLQMAIPLSIAFCVLTVMNTFAGVSRITRYVGSGTGLRGIIFSTLAGVVSMGPVFAWYPLLKDLKAKGASDFHLANFLGNRSVKPYILPLMVYYFGWVFTVAVNVAQVAVALATGALMEMLSRKKPATPA